MYRTRPPDSAPPPADPAARYVLPLAPELPAEIIRDRVAQVNVLLRASLLGSLHMALDVALNVLVDQAAELVPFDQALLYLWDEDLGRLAPLVSRGVADPLPESLAEGNLLTEWTIRHAQPLRVPTADTPELAAAFEPLGAASALAVPLLVSGQARGSLQLFSSRPDAFSVDDVRLVFILAVQAEAILHRHQDRELLARLATTDALTGLYNRRHFDEELAREMTRSIRGRHPVSLLMADVDHFKEYNDRYTHLAGDQALCDVAAIMTQETRRGDTVCRFGGEEFAVILPETDEVGALTFARRITEAVERHRFSGAGGAGDVRLTISIGTATAPTDARDHRALVHAADLALYRAKVLGRNRVVQAAELGPGGTLITAEAPAIDYDLVVRAVTSFSTFGQLLDLLTRMVMEAVGARRCSLLVLDREGGGLTIRSAHGQALPPSALATVRVGLGEGVAGVVAEGRHAFATADVFELAARLRGLKPNGAPDYASRSCLAAPLLTDGQLIGTLHLADKRRGEAFDDDDLAAVLPLADSIADFLVHGLDFERQRRGFIELATTAIAATVDARVPLFRGHGQRVAALAVALARELPLPEPQVTQLRVAALLHDIGRLAITGDLFLKPGPLTEAEVQVARNHTRLGAKILEAVPGLEAERAMILHHHERLDGTGYPDGLVGAAIPLATRILSVADAYDAMTSPRPYRPARPAAESLAEIRRGAGSQFDYRVVAALGRLLGRRFGTSAA
jgi:diguanylate cyclase (GGDEF)-like protein/putative nucleotidyltransferase with HDIG domain